MATPSAYPAQPSASNAPRAYLLQDIPRLERTIERFWTYVDKSAGPEACWPWRGRRKKPHPIKGKQGYGYFDLQTSLRPDPAFPCTVQAHRFSFLVEWGFLPDDLFVLHTCHNPPCVNPAHLKLGSHKDNMEDASAAGRWPTGENHYTALRPETIRYGEQIPVATLTTEQVLLIRYAKYVLGYSLYAIGQITGKSTECIWHICHDTWQHLPPNAHLALSPELIATIPPKPEKKASTILTAENKKEILRLRRTTSMTYKEIAAQFDVVPQTVKRVVYHHQDRLDDAAPSH